MKIRTLLLTTFLTGSTLIAIPALAASQGDGMPAQNVNSNSTGSSNNQTTNSTTASPMSAQNDQQMQTVNAAAAIMGNINIAQVALTYGMNDDASSHIDAARKAISGWDSQAAAAEKPTVPMTAGKMSYKTAQGHADYWIPVVNDRFAVQEFGGKHFSSKKPDIDVTDAESINYQMLLDTKIADAQLAKAQTAISQKQYDVAMNALYGVSNGAITETLVTEKPMAAARDNLIVARELLRDKDYRGASFALKHANADLSQVEKDNPGSANNASIKTIRSQITALQITINKDNPSVVKTAEDKIEGWIKDVKAKI